MNIYALVIVCALLLDYTLNLVANLLNVRALQPDLPPELAELYDNTAYRQSQAYTRVHTRFGILTSTCMLAIILAFWFSGGFYALEQLVRGWQLGQIGTGLAYIGLLMLGRGLLALPFSVYDTFVIEARFGFNTTTPQTFLLDLAKMLALSILLGAPLLAGVLAFLTYAGPYAWAYCWLAMTVFTLFLQWLAPTWLMPLFNTFTPLAQGELRQAIMDYARRVRFAVEDIAIMDGSRRSGKSNAFFTGFGKHKRIALFDTLVEQHTVPELVAVLAHEIGHYKRRHILQHMLLSMVHTGVLFYLLSIFLQHPGLFQAFYVPEPAVHSGLVFFSLLYSPIALLLGLGMQMVSRQHEYEADHYAAATLATAEPLIEALKKLARHNLSNLTPHPLYVFLHYSHPPILARLQALQANPAPAV
jgi:STE24 endopeptidase